MLEMILAIKVSPMNHFLSFKVYGLWDAISAAVGCSLAASDNL